MGKICRWNVPTLYFVCPVARELFLGAADRMGLMVDRISLALTYTYIYIYIVGSRSLDIYHVR